MAEYENLEDTLHTLIYNILKSDSNILSYTSNIYDGVPVQMRKGTGFPYIIVHTPIVRESQITGSKSRVTLRAHIEVIDKKESNVRKLSGYVRSALKSNRTITFEDNLFNYNISNTYLNRNYVDSEMRIPVWHMDIYAEYSGVFE